MTRVTAAAGAPGYQGGMSKSFLRPVLADWKRWSPAERVAAILLLAGLLLLQVPLVL